MRTDGLGLEQLAGDSAKVQRLCCARENPEFWFRNAVAREEWSRLTLSARASLLF
jgi:hypothetical protein